MAVKRKAPQGAKVAKKKSARSSKHVGDVLGLSGSRPPKPKTPLKSAAGAGKRRTPKGIEVKSRRKRRSHLSPARVRG